MARGQVISYQITGTSSGLVSAAASGAASLDKLGAAAARSTTGAGRLADSIGKTATTMARSASLFGLPIPALRALDDAADIAEIGFKNLSTGMAGFNTASVGVVGAGLAIGAMLGTLARKSDAVSAAADRMGKKLHDAMFGGGAPAAGFSPGMRALLAEGAAQAQGRAQVQQLELAKGLSASGLNADQIKDVLAGKEAATAAEQFISKLREQEAATKRAALEAKRLGEAHVTAMRAAQKAHDDFNRSLIDSTAQAARDLQVAMIAGSTARMDASIPGTLIAPMARGRDLSGLMAGVASGEINAGVRATDITLEKATTSTQKWVAALSAAAHAMELLGVASESALGKAISATASGAALGAQMGLAIGGPHGAAVGAIIGGGVGLLSSLFGGGPSKEEREAERRKAEQERARISAAAKEMRGKGIDSLSTVGPQFFMERTITDQDSAQRQGTLFAAAWGTVVREKGIAAAAAAFGDAWKKMKADMEAAGIEMPAWMKAISGQMDLGLDPAFKAVAEAAFTAAEFLKAFAEAGGTLTPDVQKAFEQEARAAFGGGKQAALDLGQGEEEAVKAGFAAANPLLRGLLDQSIVQGVALSADIQAMIDAAGIVPSEMVQSLEELRAIRRAVEGLAGIPGAPIPGGGGGGHGLPEFAKGGDTDWFAPRGGGPGGRPDGGFPAIVHPRELIIPKEKIPSFLKAHGAGSDSNTGMALNSMLRELKNQPPAITANVTLNTDTSMLPRHSQQDFLDEQEKRLVRSAQPGGALHREMVATAESVVRKRNR